ncbi:MAG: hypothetical protein MK052_02645 [Alphaproteobacteria bacterium]|nr:hypothetical protein [Alphaproteobacteria bacterium]
MTSSLRQAAAPQKKISHKIVKAARNQPWSLTLLNLAWTAGPVTFLAIQGGYFLGFGKDAPIDAFIYFAGYTLIAGFLAIAVQVFRHALYLPKVEAEEQLLNDTVDQLFMLNFAVRNEYLRSYSDEDQKILAAWWGIRSAATDINMLQESIRNVSQDDSLARAIKRIEFYRRQGLADLLQKEYKLHAKIVHDLTEILAMRFPELAHNIKCRFRGVVPSIRDGQPRVQGFLERLLSAGDQDRPELASADDVLAMIHFTIELLLGREVIALHPRFDGHKKLEDAKDEFDRLLSDFRLLRRKRNSGMRALISDLNMRPDSEIYQAMHASSEQLLPMLIDALKQRDEENFGIRRYAQIHQWNTQLVKAWKKLAEHERYYNRLWAKEGHKLRQRISESQISKHRKSALIIVEHEISLNKSQKIQVARKIYAILDDLVIRKTTLMGLLQTKSGLKQIDMDDYKKLAGDLLDILDEHLNISEPSEQQAIEESREADFGSIEPDLAAQTKCAWGRVTVAEVQEDRRRIAHRLAQSLVGFFNVQLGDATMDYLVETYGASREFLEQLHSADIDQMRNATDALRSDLLTLPKWGDLKLNGA